MGASGRRRTLPGATRPCAPRPTPTPRRAPRRASSWRTCWSSATARGPGRGRRSAPSSPRPGRCRWPTASWPMTGGRTRTTAELRRRWPRPGCATSCRFRLQSSRARCTTATASSSGVLRASWGLTCQWTWRPRCGRRSCSGMAAAKASLTTTVPWHSASGAARTWRGSRRPARFSRPPSRAAAASASEGRAGHRDSRGHDSAQLR
mmetsp:Transcript_67132/g.189095  ORF Transcript_67132/g.189095 Transcript_67132/m.189095 type:complete len:206 (-) Transcript_67132:97-714(-)